MCPSRHVAWMVVLAIVSPVNPAVAEAPCDQWLPVNPLPADQDLLGATHAGGLFVLVGRSGTVLISPDELSWRQVDTPTEADLHAVVWTGEVFVTVGEGGWVLTSPDGVVWTSRSAGTVETLVDVTVGGPVLVAVGTHGAVVTSTDGVIWSPQPPAADEELRAVTWTGSEYLAAGGGRDVLVSSDGTAWTARSIGHDGPFSEAVSNGSTTLVAASDGYTLVSTDGLHWTRGAAGRELTEVIWAGDRFIAAGHLSRYAPLYSGDGVHWSWGRNAAPGLLLGTLAWSGSEIVAAGAGGAIAVSRDGGGHYKPVNTFAGLDLYGIAANGSGAVLAAGTETASEGAILASDDLLNWEVVYRMGLESIYDVAASDGLFVAVGVINELWDGGAMILRSLDGRNWVGAVGPVSGPGYWPWEWYSATWDGARFVVVGDGGSMALSQDASSWYLLGGELGGPLLGVASDGSTIVAVGGSGLIVRSDGESLSVVDSGQTAHLYDVALGPSLFVAVGAEGTVLTSSNGEVWEEQASGTTVDLHGVRFTGDHFVAVGSAGVVLASEDGVTWQPAGVTGSGVLLDVIRDGSSHVAAGEKGQVFQSICSGPDDPPAARFVWRPTLPEEGTPVRFNDLSAGDPIRWQWDFGDGSTAEGRAVTHAFPVPGEWPVTLTVGNDHGDSDTTAQLTVRPFCGAPPPAEVSAPASVASGQPYEVSWTPTLQPHEHGEYSLLESVEPSFADPDGWGTWRETSVTVSHPWTEGASFFYRVIAINYCPDASYWSQPSATVRVDIEPDLERLGDHVRVIPAAAHGAGLKSTSWVTDVVVHNPGEHAAPAYLFLLQRDGVGEPVASERYWIEPGQSLRLDDAVGSLQSPGYGALLVASDRPLMVGSRTANTTPDGSFGQFLEGVPVVGGTAGANDELRLIELTHDDRYRTNLGLANPLPADAVVQVRLHLADGELVDSLTYDLPGLSSSMDVEVFAGDGNVADGYAVVSSSSPAAAYVAVASVVDNLSGDPVALTALEDRWRHRSVTRSELPLIRDQAWYDLIDAGGIYVALGHNVLAWSRDGLEWHAGWEFDGWWDAPDSLAWNGSQVLAVGQDWAYRSPDGISWSRTPLPGNGFSSAAWDGSRWVAVHSASADQTDVGFSQDGTSWQRHVLEGVRLQRIVWAGDRYVATGPSGLAVSWDGLAWEFVGDLEGWLYGAAWSGEQLLVHGAHQVYVSVDFDQFDVTEFDRDIGGVVWAGDRWVVSASVRAGEESGAFLISPDGHSWESVARSGARFETRNIAWDGSTVLVIDFDRSLSWLVGDLPAVTVPAAAHLSGFAGSRWRTDLQLHNPRSAAVSCTVELLERGVANEQPRSMVVDLAPQSSRRLEDVLASEFGFLGAAALGVRPENGAVLVSSRTYNDAPEGSYGQLVPGMRRSEAIWPFETGRLIQLRHSPDPGEGFRTNIGLVSLCAEPMEVTVHLFMGSGELLGGRTASLAPWGVTQINNVFGPLTHQTVADGFAILSSDTPRCAFHGYASVVDNLTNDPILVPVKPWTPILFGGDQAQ